MKRIALSLLLGFFFLSAKSALGAAQYIFSAPPRGPAEKEIQVYKPIADYLSKALDKKIVYRHPGNWLTYQNDMQRGVYDLVFDGPHFVSWRIERTQHTPLVKLPGKLAFVVLVKKDNTKINSVKQLRGRTVCGLAPPNLATLTLYSLFDNPIRQPLVIEIKSFPEAFKNVLEGRCEAAVMRDKMLDKLDKNKSKTRVIFHSRGVANQTFSAGPRFTVEDRKKIAAALLAPESQKHMLAFHARFNKKKKPLLRAESEEYAQLDLLLKDVWGFNQ